jgi:hypothetical protein
MKEWNVPFPHSALSLAKMTSIRWLSYRGGTAVGVYRIKYDFHGSGVNEQVHACFYRVEILVVTVP